jgi:hypothetical protein
MCGISSRGDAADHTALWNAGDSNTTESHVAIGGQVIVIRPKLM